MADDVSAALGSEAQNVSEPVTVEEKDPLSFESTANDYFDIVGVAKDKRAMAAKALKNAIMACMGTEYPTAE